MASDFDTSTFDDLIRRGILAIGDGYRAKLEELGGDGPIFLRAGLVSDTHISFNDAERFHQWLASKVASKMSKAGDVVITTKGNSTGRVAYVDYSMPPFVYSPHLSYWRSLKPDALVPGYLRYWSRGEEFQRQLRGLSTSTDMAPYLSLVDQKRLIISLPAAEEQRAISHILGTLDDKIELNREMNGTLEAIARVLFRSWFVDFDPVRAKASGELPESICRRLSLTPDLLALFPNRLVDSKLGEIPEGWEVKVAGELTDVGIGKTPPRKEPQWFSEDLEHFRWVSIRDMGLAETFIQQSSERLTPEAVDRFNIRVVPAGTVLLSFKLTIGRVAITDVELTTNEAIAHFKLSASSPLTTEYLYLYLQQFDYTKLGSTSSIAEAVNSRMIRELPVLLPPQTLIRDFSLILASNFAKQRANARESATLGSLRDTLLPALLSGDLDVSTFDGLVEG